MSFGGISLKLGQCHVRQIKDFRREASPTAATARSARDEGLGTLAKPNSLKLFPNLRLVPTANWRCRQKVV